MKITSLNHSRISSLLVISIPLFFLHGLEEGTTGILKLDPFLRSFGSFAALALFIELVLFSIILYLAATEWGGSKINRILLLVSGILFLFETQHIYGAISKAGYYPGLYTAILLVITGLLYWKWLFKRD